MLISSNYHAGTAKVPIFLTLKNLNLMLQAILVSLEIKHINDDCSNYCEDEDGSKQYYDAIGIKAEATIYIPFEIYTGKGKEINYKMQTIDTGGLWGIEEDSEESYKKEVAEEELSTLKDYLQILNVNTDGGIRFYPASEKNKDASLSFDELSKIALNNIPEYVYQ